MDRYYLAILGSIHTIEQFGNTDNNSVCQSKLILKRLHEKRATEVKIMLNQISQTHQYSNHAYLPTSS